MLPPDIASVRANQLSFAHKAVVWMILLFPLPYALDLNVLGGLSAQGLESPLPRIYTGFLLVFLGAANLKSPRPSGFTVFTLATLMAAYIAFALGFSKSPNPRSVISLVLLLAVSIGNPARYAAALQHRQTQLAFVLSALICGLEALRETISPAFVAANIDFSRVSGGFSHPNAFALFLIALYIAILNFQRAGSTKTLCILIVLFSIGATRSLSALILLVLVSALRLRALSLKSLVAGFIMISVVGALLSGELPFSRAEELRSALVAAFTLDTSGINYGSLQWRLAVWQENVGLMRQAGWSGFGMGSFSEVSGVGNLAHNVYVQLTVESGLFGLISYLFGILITAFAIISGPSPKKGLAVWLVLVVAGGSLNVLNYSAAILFLVYLCVSLSRGSSYPPSNGGLLVG